MLKENIIFCRIFEFEYLSLMVKTLELHAPSLYIQLMGSMEKMGKNSPNVFGGVRVLLEQPKHLSKVCIHIWGCPLITIARY
jgi:hypothetical protein